LGGNYSDCHHVNKQNDSWEENELEIGRLVLGKPDRNCHMVSKEDAGGLAGVEQEERTQDMFQREDILVLD
jgi:hypothetical protein